MNTEDIRNIGLLIGGILLGSLFLGTFLLVLMLKRIRDLDIPQDATFAETLHYTPFLLVIAIDLLDLALDILAAPLSWVILDRLGLKALRGFAAVEAFIPFTQVIPTMTICWLGVRLFDIGEDRKVFPPSST